MQLDATTRISYISQSKFSPEVEAYRYQVSLNTRGDRRELQIEKDHKDENGTDMMMKAFTKEERSMSAVGLHGCCLTSYERQVPCFILEGENCWVQLKIWDQLA